MIDANSAFENSRQFVKFSHLFVYYNSIVRRARGGHKIKCYSPGRLSATRGFQIHGCFFSQTHGAIHDV